MRLLGFLCTRGVVIEFFVLGRPYQCLFVESDLEAFRASSGFVSVLSVVDVLLSAFDCWAFRASVELFFFFARLVGSSESAPLGICFLSVFVHPVDSCRVLVLGEFFLSVFDS